jgi:hypothetical protein
MSDFESRLALGVEGDTSRELVVALLDLREKL